MGSQSWRRCLSTSLSFILCEDRYLEVQCPVAFFCGTVSGIPGITVSLPWRSPHTPERILGQPFSPIFYPLRFEIHVKRGQNLRERQHWLEDAEEIRNDALDDSDHLYCQTLTLTLSYSPHKGFYLRAWY